MHDDWIAAVIERKTVDNLLGDIGQLQILHHQLAELATYPRPALVVEARYEDFLTPARLAGRWPAAPVARVLAELSAEHPRLPMVFAGKRKYANERAAGFFRAAAARLTEPAPDSVAEPAAGDRPPSPGPDLKVRQAVLHELPTTFPSDGLAARFPDVPMQRPRRVLRRLREEGKPTSMGHGRGTRWIRGSG